MQRRNFLKTGTLAGLTLTTLSAVSCAQPSTDTKADSGIAPADDFELNEVTIDELQKKMQDGTYTARSITELYLKRIEAIDKAGPKLNSVIELNKNALEMADTLDKERKAGVIHGPLHGIPVLIKDNIDTGDTMHTTAGSLALADHFAKQDAFIVHKLRQAGAVILGKTNLSEWANFRSSRSTSGWSCRGLQTKNPYVLDRGPSGSSAGSGSAAAANLCAIAIGTETDGSVVSPASVAGLVGIKPTVGLWSRSGIIPISITQDTAGPMTRTVRDAAILLGALAGADANDSYTLKAKPEKDYTKFLDANGLKGKRIGFEKIEHANDGTLNLIKEAKETLKKQGAEVIEVEVYKALKPADGAEFQVLLYEFKDGLNKYLGNAGASVKNLADVIAFNKSNEGKAMPFFKQETLIEAQGKGDLTTKEYTDALAKSTGVSRKAIDTILTENKLDAICGPTNGFASCIDLINGDYDNGFSFSTPAAMAGYPHITVPMGAWHDLPMGLSFFGTAWKEGELLTLAYAYEQASKKRKKPEFKENLFA
ncbi:amidase [Mucilaginibacter sp. ZT4R22]|uniref:Amidase n=1 Tax=Mucilaginibacter pankratovii TaxID=2772110 RepID=A0ABR7WXQ8_9SPHI|nr:amidase [Mucilaginibacter pankratovii]MBD1367079.1 amidase [Mucilaginibacter pankratovii]